MKDMNLDEAVQFLTPFADKCWDARSDVIYGRENGQAGRALKVVLAALAASPTPSNDTLQGRGEVEDAAKIADEEAEVARKAVQDSSGDTGAQSVASGRMLAANLIASKIRAFAQGLSAHSIQSGGEGGGV